MCHCRLTVNGNKYKCLTTPESASAMMHSLTVIPLLHVAPCSSTHNNMETNSSPSASSRAQARC
jgi:hypothetical protein